MAPEIPRLAQRAILLTLCRQGLLVRKLQRSKTPLQRDTLAPLTSTVRDDQGEVNAPRGIPHRKRFAPYAMDRGDNPQAWSGVTSKCATSARDYPRLRCKQSGMSQGVLSAADVRWQTAPSHGLRGTGDARPSEDAGISVVVFGSSAGNTSTDGP